MPHRHRKDSNHNALAAELTARGWYVQDASQTGLGYDLLIAKAGRLLPVEIKDGEKSPSRQRLTPHEKAVHASLGLHGVEVLLLTCSEDIEQLERPRRAGSYDDRNGRG